MMTTTTAVLSALAKISNGVGGHIQQSTNSCSGKNGGSNNNNGSGNGDGDGNNVREDDNDDSGRG